MISLGLGRLVSIGVHLRCCIPICISFPALEHFCMMHLTVPTSLSTSPFDWAYLGEVVVCLMFHLLHMSLYGFLTYCGSLSVTISMGGPNRLKHSAVRWAVVELLVDCTFFTYGNLER